jgi:hypothetical protein
VARLPLLPALLVAVLAGCPGGVNEVPEELSLEGQLDRDSVSGGGSIAVPVSFRSTGSRAEWWPCDLRLTAQGCVGDHHVNVYITRGDVPDFSGVGGAACVSGDTADGVYEAIQAKSGGTHALGSELNAWVVVASDVDGAPGAVFNDDAETTAATRLTSGELAIVNWAGLDFIGLTIAGTTAEGRSVDVSFAGPVDQPGVVPTLEGPSTCVESAVIGP